MWFMRRIGSLWSVEWKRRDVLAVIVATGAAPACVYAAETESAKEIDRDARAALRRLQAQGTNTQELTQKAIAILMFPKIIKGGLIVGGQYGEGALLQHGKTIGYYSIAAGSFGLQAGGQSFSYGLLFLKQSALDYLRKSNGWAIGSGPSVVVMDKGAAKSLTSTTITQDVVAIPFGQHGLMAGVGLEGSKITPFTPGG
jgi:lipid-binding SYLF domain-containing protein